jgi:hypothetical protein
MSKVIIRVKKFSIKMGGRPDRVYNGFVLKALQYFKEKISSEELNLKFKELSEQWII